jgi:hypothetical protein
LTNHSIVSLVDEKAAKVRCRTCYHDHDYRNEEPLPSKKELKRLAEEAALKAAGGDGALALDGDDELLDGEEPGLEEDDEGGAPEADEDEEAAAAPVAKKAVKKAAKKAAAAKKSK